MNQRQLIQDILTFFKAITVNPVLVKAVKVNPGQSWGKIDHYTDKHVVEIHYESEADLILSLCHELAEAQLFEKGFSDNSKRHERALREQWSLAQKFEAYRR